MKAIAVVPTYNERDNLKPLLELIDRHAPGLHVLVVDDNSPDGTGDLADELSQSQPGRIFVLHRRAKEGLGRAYVDGFRYAYARSYDAIIQMDADLSHDPQYIPELLERIRSADLVLGSRYLHGISVVNWDFKRLLLSKMATLYVRLVTGMPVSDATGGYKCWRRSALASIGLETLFSNGYLFQVETTYRAYRRQLHVAEMPIIFVERRLGHSKMRARIILEAIVGVIRLRLADLIRRRCRPRGELSNPGSRTSWWESS